MRRLSQAAEKKKKTLINELKKSGEYQGFSKTNGFVYLLPNGEVDGKSISMRVSIKGGKIKVLDPAVSIPLQKII